MKIAAYIRVSTEQQLENFSIPLQIERIKGYCMSRGWSDVTEFIDGGYSGSNIQRPELQKLISNIKDYDAVIVYRLDRLSRSQKDTLHLIEEVFLPNDVEFISISETIDTSSPFGRAMIGILSVFSQLERETIIERLKGGKRKLVSEKGYWAGGADRDPTGYIRETRGKLIINPEEAELVKKVYEWYLLLQSITKVQKRFEEEGLPSWRFSRLRHILTNRLYLGEVSFGVEWFPGAHEPLVDKDTFDSVQLLLSENKGSNFGKIKHMVLTKKVKCDQCGEDYQSFTKSDKLADGTKILRRYYTCKRKKAPKNYDHKCYNKTLKRDFLEGIVFKNIDRMDFEIFTKMQKKNNPQVDYEKKINAVDKQIKMTLDLYLNNKINPTILDEKMDQLNNEKKELQVKKELSLNSKYKKIAELLKDKTFKMVELENAEKIAVINTLIKQISIDNEEVMVTWEWE